MFSRHIGWTLLTAAMLTGMATSAIAQGPEMKDKIAALKQSADENKQKLRHYQWTETQQITLKGEAKPERVSQCSYGPNGQVQKIPMGAQQQPAEQGRGGRRGGGALRQHVVEKKTEEMKDYMQQVQSLLSLYVPPNSSLIQEAVAKKNVSFNMTPGGGPMQIIFRDYAKAGDKMSIGYDAAAKKIRSISVDTYMDEPKDVVTLAVNMASLSDGTNYAAESTLNATAKKLQVVTRNSNYVKLQ